MSVFFAEERRRLCALFNSGGYMFLFNLTRVRFLFSYFMFSLYVASAHNVITLSLDGIDWHNGSVYYLC